MSSVLRKIAWRIADRSADDLKEWTEPAALEGMREALLVVLDRLGFDPAAAANDGTPPDGLLDLIQEHVAWLERRAAGKE